jgi:hypothetical protein
MYKHLIICAVNVFECPVFVGFVNMFHVRGWWQIYENSEMKMYMYVCTDTRRDLCYSQYRDGQCLNPTAIPVTKSSCCCCTVITGQPMGWGTPCQPCPPQGSLEFQSLCPHGAGMTFNGDGKSASYRAVYIYLHVICYVFLCLVNETNTSWEGHLYLSVCADGLIPNHFLTLADNWEIENLKIIF